MRGSIAKRLRRITKYDPSNPGNEYFEKVVAKQAKVPIEVNAKGFIMVRRVTTLLEGTCPRAKYQRAKAIYPSNKKVFAKSAWQVGI